MIVSTLIADDAENAEVITPVFTVTAVEPDDNANLPDLDTADGPAAGGADKGDRIVIADATEDWNKDIIQSITSMTINGDKHIVFDNSQSFIVQGAIIGLTKEVSIEKDPINNTTKPKAIPGAVIKYTLTINNSGLAAAENIAVSDLLPIELILATGADAVYLVGATSLVPNVATSVGSPQLDIIDESSTKKLTFSKITVPAAVDNAGTVTDGTTVITFTALIP